MGILSALLGPGEPPDRGFVLGALYRGGDTTPWRVVIIREGTGAVADVDLDELVALVDALAEDLTSTE